MTDKNHEQGDGGGPGPKTELDRTLDAALAKYAAVEPRVGLEERILANLRAERTRVVDRSWWRWGHATAAAVMVVAFAVGLAWKTVNPGQPIVKRPPVTNEDARQPHMQVVAHDTPRLSPRVLKAARQEDANRVRVHAASSKPPMLDQFPSPQPLSEQEKILASYVEKYPEHAALLAEARMKALRRDAEERRQLTERDSQQ